ncbi:hypothetical protein K2173_015996 [Erythroxylum novogranatense]|uniref:Secreted protein n=1 Tax=Erythroxylum novogranatense TaxID=1862640 RepID=A0AAV8SFJ8_9ROSI|nr:hypothetical protein K2173_015996 [Erythroxylum novogranatense]
MRALITFYSLLPLSSAELFRFRRGLGFLLLSVPPKIHCEEMFKLSQSTPYSPPFSTDSPTFRSLQKRGFS